MIQQFYLKIYTKKTQKIKQNYLMIQKFYLKYIYQKTGRSPNIFLYTLAHSSIIYKSHKVETNQISINKEMDKQNVECNVYIQWLIFSLKEEWNSDICYNINELYAKLKNQT